MKYEIYQDKRDEWRWRLKAANGKILAVSSEGYKRQDSCEACMIKTRLSGGAPIIYP